MGGGTVKGLVVGSHRRQRSSRSGHGAVWAGIFLLLAAVAAVASRGLWSGLFAGLFGLGPETAPQAKVLWQAPCAQGATCSVGSDGRVLLVSTPAPAQAGETGAAEPATRLDVAEAGSVRAVLERPATALTLDFFDPALAEPPGDRSYTASDWRLVTVKPGEATGTPALVREEVSCVETGGVTTQAYASDQAVVTAACAWVDEANLLLGVYRTSGPDAGTGCAVAVDVAGKELWSRPVGDGPVHRVTARPGTGLVAAATPRVLALLDSHGNLLWSKKLRQDITDLGLQSHGGPAVIAGGVLLAYDRRGNLIWRKEGQEPFRALACAGDRIAVAGASGVSVFDEDGLERWSLATASRAVCVALDAEAGYLAVVLDSGTLVLAERPGVRP